MAKARLRRGIEIVKLANRIESLKMQEDDIGEAPGEADVPADSKQRLAMLFARSKLEETCKGVLIIAQRFNASLALVRN